MAQLLEVQHHVDWCLEGWSVIVEAQLVDLEEIIWKSFAKSKDLKMFITYQNWVGQKRLYLCPQEEATYEYVLYSCWLGMLEPVWQFRHLHLKALTSESFSLWTPKRSSRTSHSSITLLVTTDLGIMHELVLVHMLEMDPIVLERCLLMQWWWVSIGCGKEVFCSHGNFQSMLRVFSVQWASNITHTYLSMALKC